MLVQKKMVVLNAEEWVPGKKVEGIVYKDSKPYVDSLEGYMSIKPNDIVMTGIEGEKYTIDRTIFEKTYDIIKSDIYNISQDPCLSCNNHPKNGGTGACCCTLGMPKITC